MPHTASKAISDAAGVPRAARVIDLESIPMVERAHVRSGVFRSRRLLAGEPGTPGNFSLQLSHTPDTYFSPRHRHNFDQVRCQLEGEFDFASDGVMKPGTVAYFPEGTFYGPQSSGSSSLTLVLQFGGASGNGYLSAEQYEQAAAELAKMGSFERGVFTQRRPDGSRSNQDAYEAVWEQVNGRPLVYPPERYLHPVFMAPDHFGWLPVEGQAGACCKSLGEFSERGTRLAFYRLEPEASLRLAAHSIYFAIEGTGRVGEREFGEQATIHTLAAENAVLAGGGPVCVSSRKGLQIFHIGLPRFR